MPALLGGAGFGIINGHLYVAGGRSDANIVLNSLYDYDIAADTWTTKASLPVADNVPGSGVAAGQLVLMGGGNPFAAGSNNLSANFAPETTNQVMIYDPGTDAWSAGPSLVSQVAFPSAANVDDSYLVSVGGYDGASTTTITQVSTITGGGGGCPTATNTPVVTATATQCTDGGPITFTGTLESGGPDDA